MKGDIMSRTLKCIAIDDEPMALLVIEQFCRRKGGMELSVFSEPRVGLEAIRRDKPDLVFLDIQMNSINGLEIADTLPFESCFIFTTAYAEYALEGFNLDAVDFLHKPFSYERFEVAVEKALRRMDAHRPVLPECLVVKQEYNNVSIPLGYFVCRGLGKLRKNCACVGRSCVDPYKPESHYRYVARWGFFTDSPFVCDCCSGCSFFYPYAGRTERARRRVACRSTIYSSGSRSVGAIKCFSDSLAVGNRKF